MGRIEPEKAREFLRQAIGERLSDRASGGSCPSIDEFIAWIEKPRLGRKHLFSCRSCSNILEKARAQISDWKKAPLAVTADLLELPRGLKTAVSRLRSTAAQTDAMPGQVRLVVLHVVEWAAALVAPPSPLPRLAYRSGRRTAARSVPVVEEDLSVVALDKAGQRIAGVKATLSGPYSVSSKSPGSGRKSRSRPARRNVESDRTGVFRLRGLKTGRYLLKTKNVETEIVVAPASPEILP